MATSPRPEWDRILSSAQKNNAVAIKKLVDEEGVDPNHTNVVGQSSLHIASLWGNVDAVCALLSFKEIQLNIQNRVSGASPLHSALQSNKEPAMNRVKCVQLLLDAGANPHLQDLYGKTPLDVLDAEVSADNASAIDMEYATSMRKILEAGMVQDSVLIPLVDSMDLEGMINQLKGGDLQVQVDERDKRSGMTALSLAIQKIDDILAGDDKDDWEEEYMKIYRLSRMIDILLLNGANANAVADKAGVTKRETLTPLHQICKILYYQYTNSAINGDETRTVQEHLEKIACTLRAHGAEQSSSTIHFMHDAARRGNMSAMRFWIEELGLDPNTKGRQGLTALHFASRSGRVEIVRYLMDLKSTNTSDQHEHVVDISILDDRGKTALDAATVNNKTVIIDMLQCNERN